MLVDEHLLLERVEAADAGAEPHAFAGRVDVGVARHGEGLSRSRQRELGEAVGAARFLRVVEVLLGFETDHVTEALRGRSVESVPERLDADADRRDDADAGDGYASLRHHFFDMISS